jgi:YfaZ precursor
MVRGWTGGAALAALSLAPLASAQDPSNLPGPEKYGLRLQYREFRPGVSGEAQKGSGDKAGSIVDVDNDLGITDKRTFDVRGTIQFRKGWKLRGSYTPLSYKGDTEVNTAFTYGETRYSRFDRVASTVKGAYYSADLEWDFIKGAHGFLGAVVGAKLFDVDAALVNVSTNSREIDTLTSPVPVIGLASRVYAGRFSVEGEVTGLSAGSHGSMLEAEGSVRVHISDRLAAMGGYRYLSLDGKDGQDEVKLKLGGWQFGLEISI